MSYFWLNFGLQHNQWENELHFSWDFQTNSKELGTQILLNFMTLLSAQCLTTPCTLSLTQITFRCPVKICRDFSQSWEAWESVTPIAAALCFWWSQPEQDRLQRWQLGRYHRRQTSANYQQIHQPDKTDCKSSPSFFS